MTSARRRDLLSEPVGQTLINLTRPMILGMIAVVLFNVVDTAYAGALGPSALAAIGFTFPMTFVCTSLCLGLGVGITAAVSRASGRGDASGVSRVARHGLLIAPTFVAVLAAAGLATIDPLFTLLGAPADLLPLIRSYMVPWYSGVALLTIPMSSNGVLRALGDARTPAAIMIMAALINLVLDPLFIFGFGPFPRLGLRGAALVTVFAWIISAVVSLAVLRTRAVLRGASAAGENLLGSAREILHVGLPAAGTQMLTPLALAIVTRILSESGPDAVAGFVVGARVESLAMVGATALSSAVTPFAGQNSAAGFERRLSLAMRWCWRACVTYGAAVAVALALLATPVSGLFTDDPSVAYWVKLYLWIVPISYALYAFTLASGALLNGIRRPLAAAGLVGFRSFALMVPACWIGAQSFGVVGAFAGILFTNLIAGIAARGLLRRAGILDTSAAST